MSNNDDQDIVNLMDIAYKWAASGTALTTWQWHNEPQAMELYKRLKEEFNKRDLVLFSFFGDEVPTFRIGPRNSQHELEEIIDVGHLNVMLQQMVRSLTDLETLVDNVVNSSPGAPCDWLVGEFTTPHGEGKTIFAVAVGPGQIGEFEQHKHFVRWVGGGKGLPKEGK